MTAAIVTFVFAQETGDDRLALALLLPWLVSTAAVFATSKAIPMAREHEERVVELAGTLAVGLAPHVRLLVWTVQGLRLALATTSVGLVGLAVLV